MSLVYLVLIAGLDAVAVSADGKSLAVGGQNRAAYVLDAATLEVRHRFATGTRIVGLAFAPNGTIVVEDETASLRRFDVAGKLLGRLDDAARLVAGPSGLALVGGRTTRLISLDDFEAKATLELTERPSAYAFTADGNRVVILQQSHETDDEKRVAVADFPPKLTGLAREEFRQRNDGRISLLRVHELDGKEAKRTRLWYSSDSDSTTLRLEGEVVHVLNRSNVCARVAAETKMFETPLRLNHAIGTSGDGKILVLGGRGGGIHDAGKPVPFTLGEVPGQAEYVTRLVVRPDGSAFGVTSAYRLFRLGRDGRVEKVVPVL